MALTEEHRRAIGGRLANLRQFDPRYRDIRTQTAMAAKMGISRSYYGNLELGNANVTVAQLEQLLPKAGIDPQEVLGGLFEEIAEEGEPYKVNLQSFVIPENRRDLVRFVVRETLRIVNDARLREQVEETASVFGMSFEDLLAEGILNRRGEA